MPSIRQQALSVVRRTSTWFGIKSSSVLVADIQFDFRYCSGPVEGILLIVLIFIVSGRYGPEIWDRRISATFPSVASLLPSAIAELKLNENFLGIGAVFLIFNIVSGGLNVFRASGARKRSTVVAMLGLLPFVAFSFGIFTWLKLSPSILTTHLIPFSLLVGCLFGHQVGKMIIAHVCRRPFPYFDFPIFLIVSIGNLSAFVFRNWELTDGATSGPVLRSAFPNELSHWLQGLLEKLFGHVEKIEDAAFMEGTIVHVLLCVAVFAYLRFALRVIHELCEIFDCYCLRIKKKVIKVHGTAKFPHGKVGREGTPGRMGEENRKLE
ncbi:hypothetical protein SpCBS45565_g06727 [Spizellomyces sp. 'palustris']|nr:hypothetical protein SpCBS45565_g06727 [Spizellomyces sp. 'palustris']